MKRRGMLLIKQATSGKRVTLFLFAIITLLSLNGCSTERLVETTEQADIEPATCTIELEYNCIVNGRAYPGSVPRY